MVTEEDRLKAARSLHLSVERMEWLGEQIRPFRHADDVNIYPPLNVLVDPDQETLWEIEVRGDMRVNVEGTQLSCDFYFRIFINNLELWRGSSSIPDHFTITMDGDVIFDGEVENPDDPQDDVGWERYDLFTAIRLEAWDAATALLATGRLVPNITRPQESGAGAAV